MEALIAVDSNIDVEANLVRARALLAAHPAVELHAASPLYISVAIGAGGQPADQPAFSNAAFRVASTLNAAVPHSQRSVAHLSVETAGALAVEELRHLCLAALQTETQVMVKREDEPAFAELNAADLKFVEDAVRLLYEQLDGHPAIADFKVVASHQESLHSHDAVSVIVRGIDGGFQPDLDPNILATLLR